MKGFGDRLVGHAGEFSFEQRIFHFAILLGIGLTFFGTVMDVYYQASILWDLVFLGCWLMAYYFSRVRNHFQITSVLSIGVFVFAFVPYNWVFSGGIIGIMPYYSVLFIAYLCVILKGSFRIAMVLAMAVVEFLLIGYDAMKAGSFQTVLQSNIHLSDYLIHITVILAAISVLLIVYSNTYLKEKVRGERYARTIKEHYHQQLYYMETLEQMILKLKSDRHDFNNHLGVIHGLLESGGEDRARTYARQLVNTAQEYQTIVHVPYPMVRAMLNYKLSAARDSGIELRLHVALPEGLALEEFDATVILGNLLDNAMEACAALPAERRYLSLELRYQPDYLVIQTENPVPSGQTGGKGQSTKPDAEEHGFGLANIEYLATKHNGFLKTEQANGVFRANVALLVHMQAG